MQIEPADKRRKALAASLIATKSLPALFGPMQVLAYEGKAYHFLNPYPYFHFNNWKVEDRGPLPKCLPFVRKIVRQGSKWLFGKPIRIDVPGNDKLQEYLRAAWQANRMPTRMVAAAERGGYEGSLFLTWCYDETSDPKLSFSILSLANEARIYYDPHDRDRILMARIQYVYFDAVQGKNFWHREEWTDEKHVVYKPIEAKNAAPKGDNPFSPPIEPTYDEFQERKEYPNPWKVIPGVVVRNIDNDTEWGQGDLWTLYRVIDRVNLTYSLMDKSNQLDVDPTQIYIDLEPESDDSDRPLAPRQVVSLRTVEDKEGKPGQVVQLEARGSLRPAMMEFAKELTNQVTDAAGGATVRPDEITNKGNLTRAVLEQLYSSLIESTEEKRKTYGEDGICKLLERLSIGMKNAGYEKPVFGSVNPDDHESYDVLLQWPDYFPLTDEEKAERTNTTALQVEKRFLTQDRAVQKIAHMEGIEDVDKLLKEIDAEPPPEDPNNEQDKTKSTDPARGKRKPKGDS